MKAEHEVKLNHTEMTMIRRMCGVKLHERKKSEQLGKVVGLEPVSLTVKKGVGDVWTMDVLNIKMIPTGQVLYDVGG